MMENLGDSNAQTTQTPPSLATLLRLGASSAVARPGSSFVVLPTLAAVAVGGCLVPMVNFAFLLVGLAPVACALPAVALAIARREQQPAREALSGFRRYERCLGLFWVPYLIAIGASIPFLMALWADRRLFYQEAHPALFAVAVAASATIFLGALHRYALAPFAVFSVERGAPFPAVLEHAAGPMESHRGALLGRLAGLVAVAFSGTALFGVGALVTAPWALVSAAHLYLAVRPRDDADTNERLPSPTADWGV